jgi:hypothetical protein
MSPVAVGWIDDRTRHGPFALLRCTLINSLVVILFAFALPVGYFFPTYVTPRVVVRFEFIGKDGEPLPDTQIIQQGFPVRGLCFERRSWANQSRSTASFSGGSLTRRRCPTAAHI